MSHWQDMLRYVGWSPQDEANLRRAWPLVEPHKQALVDQFYQVILGHEDARSVFQDLAQVNRLKETLKVWMQELLNGPWDEAYFERRQRIGKVHVRVGLPERYMFTAMNQVREGMVDIVFDALEPAEAREVCRSLSKVGDLDLAAMTSTYHAEHEWEELRTLQDLIIRNMPVTVLVLDEKGRVNSATAPGTRLLNPQAKVGASVESFLPPALWEAADLDAALARASMTGRVVTMPRTLLLHEGHERHFRITLVPLQHELAHMLIHLEELTDVVQAEVRAQHAEGLARIGTLAANIAHEIRNPLAAISATLQVIGGSLAQDDRRRKVLEKVGEQVFRLDRLVSDLLGYARPAQVKTEAVDICELVKEGITQSGVDAELEQEGGQGTRVFADPQYTTQVLVNLLQNARDAVAGEGRVWLIVGPGPVVRVRDDGPGVDPEVLSTLFEPFVTTKTRGTGLGLAISRKYIEAMGGTLELESCPDGACFKITMRAAP